MDRRRGSQQIYMGPNVQLVIDLESQDMSGFVRGVVGRVRLDHDLRCKFFARAL
jgi:hypothetical protein